MPFDMNETWKRATELVSANFQLLAILAGIFMFLPSLAMMVTVPELMDPEGAINPDAEGEEAMRQVMAFFGELLPWIIGLTIVSYIGYAAMIALIGRSGTTVGEALANGFKSLPSLIIVGIIGFVILFAGVILAMLPAMLLGILIPIAAPFLGAIFALLAMTYVIARFCLAMPVVVLESQLNPLSAVGRSWRLTSDVHTKLFGFWALLLIVYLVISLLFAGLSELVGAFGSSDTSNLVVGILNALVGMFVAMLASALLVSIYRQLSGEPVEEIGQTFE